MDSLKIYPKQFRNLRIPVEKNRCFILMPFEDSFDMVYGNIKKALNNNGFVCNRSDEIQANKPIMNKILNEIMKAHYIIADLTQQNANVFYELGIAHTFKDPQNIILISQNRNDIPFDIRHISNIIYDPENPKYLTSNILKGLEESNYLFGFYEALQQKGILSIIHDNKDEFIDYLQIGLVELVPIATLILANETQELENQDIERYMARLIKIINDAINEHKSGFLSGIMKVMFESLSTCSRFPVTDKITYDILFGDLLKTYTINEHEIVSYQTDLAITLASYRTKLNIAMNWIINYFTFSKSATIDLNRYKVERFLMVTNDKIIDNMIIDAIFHDDCHIREHLADIVGEKKLYDADKALLKQLVVEDNFFTATSIIAAIGKLTLKAGADSILLWIEAKIGEIVETKQFFVLKHCRIAINRLDNHYGTSVTINFDAKYGEYIKNYFIL